LVGLSVVALSLASVAAALFFSAEQPASPQGAAPAAARGQLDVSSTPDGAAVFVDGEPTGLRTPAVLRGLASGRVLRVRVEKAGFKSQEREITIAAGEAVARSFELLPSDGLVQFAGVPSDARIFVDDVLVVSDGKPVALPVGQHALRVETRSALVFSGTVVVLAGEQTIRVDGARTAP
jgi:hypothetical protein